MNYTTSYSDARQNFKTWGDKVCDDSVPLKIKRKRGENLYLLSEQYFLSLNETAYLMASSANRKHLKKSIEEADNGELIPFEDFS